MYHPYNFQDEIIVGFELCVTMNGTVPLSVLMRHRERVKIIPNTDYNFLPAHAIWIPQVSSEYDFLDAGASMASPIGYLPLDGGDLLIYLCKARKIIEGKISTSCELTEFIERIAKIKNLPKGHKYERNTNHMLVESKELMDYFPDIFKSNDKLLRLMLREHGLLDLNTFSFENIITLIKQGYTSINSILDADVSFLLSLSGIGKKKIEKFRQSISS